jgi:Tol biopolymer transport system component
VRRVLALGAAALLLVCSPAHGGRLPRNGLVALTDWRSGLFQLWTVDPDGRHPHRITSGLETRFPMWSPDGRTLAMLRTGPEFLFQVWTSRPDGTGMRQLTRGRDSYGPGDWSPDGRELVLSRIAAAGQSATCDCNTGTVNQVVVLGRDGAVRDVLYQSADAIGQVLWGRDGEIYFSQGAYAYTADAPVAGNRDVDAEVIFALNRTTHALRVVGSGGLTDVSPDGRHLLYVSNGTEQAADQLHGTGYVVHEIGVDGTGDRAIAGYGWVAGLAHYAPDGKSILVMASDHEPDNYRLERLNLATGRFLGYLSWPGGNAGGADEQPLP